MIVVMIYNDDDNVVVIMCPQLVEVVTGVALFSGHVLGVKWDEFENLYTVVRPKCC